RGRRGGAARLSPVRGRAWLRPLLPQCDGRPEAHVEVPQCRRTRVDVEMRAIYCVAPEKLELREAPRPELRPGWARVAIRHIGICGTDYHIFEGNFPYFEY